MLYDTIGTNYDTRRRSEPRIAALVERALDGARRVVNVGAGSGSYEPEGRTVAAVEPSRTMIAQRAAERAPAVQAVAERLPFADGTFDAALATLTLHHWENWRAGLREMRRVADDRVVLLTWVGYGGASGHGDSGRFWLLDYFPEIEAIDARIFPTERELSEVLGPIESTPVPIPWDCVDGFLCAYWRRPAAYLDADVRLAISSFSKIEDASDGLARLEEDLRTGAFERRYAKQLAREWCDFGYRVVATR
ncbi:MAG: class I SAM-dependent methyltransferase [Planctomycetota bacterium]